MPNQEERIITDKTNIVNQVNQEVIELWENLANKVNGYNLRVPLVYPTNLRRDDVILFIGMNPSFSVKGTRHLAKIKGDLPDLIRDPESFYSWESAKAFQPRLETFQKIEALAKDKYPYFDKFKEVAKEALGDSSKWEHVDLFFNHETSQKAFEKEIQNNPLLKKIVKRQLKLSLTLIKYVNPKVVVVANAGAAKLFEKKTKAGFKPGCLGKEFRLQWNKGQGYHTAVVNKRPIPVFLTSMLTGQRALDDGSFRRLKWQIKKAIEETDNDPERKNH